MSAPSQLAHVTSVHVTGSRKSWNSWLTEVCGNHKNTACIPAKSGKRARIYSSLVPWCLFYSEKFPEPSNHYQNFHELFIFIIIIIYHGEEAVCTCQFCSVSKRRKYEEPFLSLHILAVSGIQDSFMNVTMLLPGRFWLPEPPKYSRPLKWCTSLASKGKGHTKYKDSLLPVLTDPDLNIPACEGKVSLSLFNASNFSWKVTANTRCHCSLRVDCASRGTCRELT